MASIGVASQAESATHTGLNYCPGLSTRLLEPGSNREGCGSAAEQGRAAAAAARQRGGLSARGQLLARDAPVLPQEPPEVVGVAAVQAALRAEGGRRGQDRTTGSRKEKEGRSPSQH